MVKKPRLTQEQEEVLYLLRRYADQIREAPGRRAELVKRGRELGLSVKDLVAASDLSKTWVVKLSK
jgi:hypothetical protein